MPEPGIQPHTLHVISHTHWDREWYLSYPRFRFRLVRLIDRLMDLLDADPEFLAFHLDAQTICVDDYLEVKPGSRDRLLGCLRSGRILIGPWYNQNDNTLVSGEATIRNLLIGHRAAAEYAGADRVMKVGYIPDQFGNISQIPQILRGFGIGTAVHGRGLDMARETGCMEYWWESPDGSRVLTSYLAFWYNNFERIPDDLAAAVARVDAVEGQMGPVSRSRHLLLMNGVDHFEAQRGLPAQMAAVNAARKGSSLVHSTLEKYFAALEAERLDLPTHRGELRDGPSLGGLPGTLSSRVYLKQANARCQTLLERYAEPLCAIAARTGTPYPQEYLTWAWKALMQNHPHDSICGCSVDQVHRDMVNRFEQVEQVAREILEGAFDEAARKLPPPAPVLMEGRQTTFAVFNPLPFERGEIVEVTLDFPLGATGRDRGEVLPETDVEHVVVFDDAGRPVVSHVLRSEIVQERVLSPTVLPMAQVLRRFTVQFRADGVPGLGFRTFRAVGQDRSLRQTNAGATVATGAGGERRSLVVRKETMENEFFQVLNSNDGSFSIRMFDEDGNWWEDEAIDVNVYVDGGDVGDQYVYRAPRRDVLVSGDTGMGQTELIEDTPLSAAVRVRSTVDVPARATADREGRSTERVPLLIETVIRVRAGDPAIEVQATVHNAARDHRLRTRISLHAEAETTVAQQPFDVVERPRVPAERLGVVAAQHPHEQWVSVHTTEEDVRPASLTVFTDGLYEHELLPDDIGTLAITLLRCTDRLTMAEQDPLGHDRAEDGQCLGTHTFRYAVMPHQGTWEEDRVWRRAHAFHAPLLARQTPEPERGNPDHNRVEPEGPDAATRPGYLALEPAALVLSALKRAQDRDTYVARFWNIGTAALRGSLSLPGAKAAWRVNLNEERQEELPIEEDGTVAVSVWPKQIGTVEFAV